MVLSPDAYTSALIRDLEKTGVGARLFKSMQLGWRGGISHIAMALSLSYGAHT